MKKKLPTIKDIADELGISFSTVSRALHNNPRIGIKTREKVWEIAKRIEYIPNPASYFLKSNKTFTIGILIPSLYEEFFIDVITGIENVFEEKGYRTVIIQTRESEEKEQKAVDSFIKMRIDGLIVSLSAETKEYSHFQKLENYGIPVVFFDRVPKSDNFNKVICNTTFGASLAIDYFAKIGKKNIAIINGPSHLETANDRLEGYKIGLMKNKLTLNEDLIKVCDLSKNDCLVKINQLLKLPKRPDAVLAFNDYIALYSMRACQEQDLNAPHDIAFVGFGNMKFNQFLNDGLLASIDQYPIEMGISSAKLLMDCINETEEKLAYKTLMIQSNLMIHTKKD
jgi:DNA-binding LacI/PurR family transcriptional regulator